MLTIKGKVVKNMKKITLIMVVIILFFSTIVQIFNMRRANRRDARQIFEQVELILEENSRELEQTQKEYTDGCLNDARMIAYILKYNPEAKGSVEELKKIAANAQIDEIHIFDTNGVIVAGTHPEYYGYSFDSGEQMGFFKPLLTDRSLELVQDITPNTAEGKLVQYSALWSEDRDFIVEIGKYPATVLRATEKNELSYIFSLLGVGGYHLYAIDSAMKKVEGSTVASDVNRTVEEIGFKREEMESPRPFYTEIDQTLYYCLSKKIEGNYIIWTTPVRSIYRSIFVNEFLLLAGLILIALFLVYAVSSAMNRTVIDQIKRINEKLRKIQDKDFNTKVDVKDSREFLELSTHINSMVSSLLQSSEKLEMSEKIRMQKEELERQHEQLEIAVERAEAANNAKSEFLFHMSHDIRTPMNAIVGFTHLALESNELEIQKEYLKNIDISSKQLLALVNHILELARIENEKFIMEEELVDVEEKFPKLSTVFSGRLEKKNLTYTTRLNIEHPYMYVDMTHYMQIFQNVVSNAIKFTPDGGNITVTHSELPGDVPDTCFLETVVEDNGIGMSSGFLAHAYESFARERTSTDSGMRGAGLGLAIVKNLVDLMNGTISIESQQGIGTKVTIRLPHRIGEDLAAKRAEELEALDFTLLEGRRFLLAEDIDINAVIATKLLTDKGCIVERARDGVECIGMLQKEEAGYYDLVLMDIQMPNMDGYKATKSIRAFEDEKKASVPILAITANAFKEDCEKAAQSGMNGHIAKPLDPVKMFGTIMEALQERQQTEV